MKMKRYNKVFGIIFIVFGVFFTSINIYIYQSGKNFAEEHNASRYEIEFTPIASSSSDMIAAPGASRVTWPSRFKFYDENDRNLIFVDRLYEEYNDMNRKIHNAVETYQFISTILIIFSLIGLLNSISKRYNWGGYAILTIIFGLGSFQVGILTILSYIIPIIVFSASILILKADFIDWNSNVLFPFKKSIKNQ